VDGRARIDSGGFTAGSDAKQGKKVSCQVHDFGTHWEIYMIDAYYIIIIKIG